MRHDCRETPLVCPECRCCRMETKTNTCGLGITHGHMTSQPFESGSTVKDVNACVCIKPRSIWLQWHPSITSRLVANIQTLILTCPSLRDRNGEGRSIRAVHWLASESCLKALMAHSSTLPTFTAKCVRKIQTQHPNR